MTSGDKINLLITISDEAAEYIKILQNENSNQDLKLTLFSAGVGCGAPAIKIEMKQPQEEDIVQEISGFKFHIRNAIIKYMENAEIIIEDSYWGKKLKVKTVFGCR